MGWLYISPKSKISDFFHYKDGLIPIASPFNNTKKLRRTKSKTEGSEMICLLELDNTFMLALQGDAVCLSELTSSDDTF